MWNFTLRHSAEEPRRYGALCSFLVALFVALVINLRLAYFPRSHPGIGFIYNLSGLYNMRSILPVYELLAFFSLFEYVRKRVSNRSIVYILPALLFAFFMVEGHFVEIEGSVDFFNHEKFFVFLSMLAFIGHTILYYSVFVVCDYALSNLKALWYCDVEDEAEYSRAGFLRRHTFAVTFLFVLLLNIPTIALNYPGAFMWDTVSQIEQALKRATFHNYSALDPSSFLYNKHPVLHTLLIRLCLTIGRTCFHSDNAGLFLFTMIQASVIIGSIALAATILVRDLHVKQSFVLILCILYIFHPRLQRYLVLITKDGMYAAFLLSFMSLGLRFLVRRGNVSRGYVIMWCILGILTSLFRREGLFIIVPLLLCMALYKGCRSKAAIIALCIVLFCQAWSSIGLPLLKAKPASSRVVYTIPFQQTARYLVEYPDDVSDEEKEAIDRVLRYDKLAKCYKANIADAVITKFREDSTKADMLAYLKVWARMFVRHPDVYIHALVNNNHHYFYPTYKGTVQYSTQSSVKIMNVTNESTNSHFTVSDKSVDLLSRLDVIRNGFYTFPILTYINSSYLYILIAVFLIFYALRHRFNNYWILLLAAFLHIGVLVAGPTNGYYFRYTYSLVMCLPLYFFAATSRGVARQFDESTLLESDTDSESDCEGSAQP